MMIRGWFLIFAKFPELWYPVSSAILDNNDEAISKHSHRADMEIILNLWLPARRDPPFYFAVSFILRFSETSRYFLFSF